MKTHIVRGCSVDAETGGVVLEYLTPASDVRTNGLVVNHALLIPPEDQFAEIIDALEAALQAALTDALAMFEDAAALDVPSLVDDDAPSPYDNPEERS